MRVAQRFTSCKAVDASVAPFSNFLRIANGKAAPIEKRKKGNTRSTQVRPAADGSNAYAGGGVWAWNIQAGKPELNPILAQKIIPMMAISRRMSMEDMRFFIVVLE